MPPLGHNYHREIVKQLLSPFSLFPTLNSKLVSFQGNSCGEFHNKSWFQCFQDPCGVKALSKIKPDVDPAVQRYRKTLDSSSLKGLEFKGINSFLTYRRIKRCLVPSLRNWNFYDTLLIDNIYSKILGDFPKRIRLCETLCNGDS